MSETAPERSALPSSDQDALILRRMPWVMGVSLAALGATAPYLARELRADGVEGWALTLAMVSIPIARLVIGPLWGFQADRMRDDARVLRAACTVGLLGTLALIFGPSWLAPLWVMVWVAGRGGMGPVLDGMTLKALGPRSGGYGAIRAWGSLGFALAVLGAALLRDQLGIRPLWTGAALALLALLLVIPFPSAPPSPRRSLGPELRALWSDPILRWILIGAALHYAPHSVYDTWFTVLGEDMGLSSSWVGGAVALGVVVEVMALAWGARLIQRFGAERLVIFASMLAVPRWVVTAIAPPMLVMPVQALHGVTFGVFWVATVYLIDQRAPRTLTSSAQGMLGAAVGGVGAILGTLGGGMVLDWFDSRALFWGAAALGALAVLAQLRLMQLVRRQGVSPKLSLKGPLEGEAAV